MYTDCLIVGHGKVGDVTSLGIELIERQEDIVPRIVEKYKETAVDFLHVGAFSGMRSGDFHTYDVDVVPPSDVDKLVENTNHIRDRAFVAYLYESGNRIAEILNIRIQDISINKNHAKVKVNGKTGERFITIVNSLPYITQYLSIHPSRNDPSSFLWLNIGTYNHNEPLSYVGAKKLLKRTFEKANIKKPCNPHMFRHSRATELANHLTETQMCLFFGWAIGSGQVKTYVHASGRDVDNAMMKYHGLGDEETRPPKPIKCNRCNEVNTPHAKYCGKCGLGLDLKTVIDDQEKKNSVQEQLANLLMTLSQDPEEMKKFQEYITNKHKK